MDLIAWHRPFGLRVGANFPQSLDAVWTSNCKRSIELDLPVSFVAGNWLAILPPTIQIDSSITP